MWSVEKKTILFGALALHCLPHFSHVVAPLVKPLWLELIVKHPPLILSKLSRPFPLFPKLQLHFFFLGKTFELLPFPSPYVPLEPCIPPPAKCLGSSSYGWILSSHYLWSGTHQGCLIRWYFPSPLVIPKVYHIAIFNYTVHKPWNSYFSFIIPFSGLTHVVWMLPLRETSISWSSLFFKINVFRTCHNHFPYSTLMIIVWIIMMRSLLRPFTSAENSPDGSTFSFFATVIFFLV